MSTTVTTASDTYTATLLDGYRVNRATRNVIDDLLGTNDKAVSFRPAALRTGTFRLLFADYATAAAMHDDLSTLTASAAFADSERPGLDMAFVPTDELGIELDDETRSVWWVEVPFQEVAA